MKEKFMKLLVPMLHSQNSRTDYYAVEKEAWDTDPDVRIEDTLLENIMEEMRDDWANCGGTWLSRWEDMVSVWENHIWQDGEKEKFLDFIAYWFMVDFDLR